MPSGLTAAQRYPPADIRGAVPYHVRDVPGLNPGWAGGTANVARDASDSTRAALYPAIPASVPRRLRYRRVPHASHIFVLRQGSSSSRLIAAGGHPEFSLPIGMFPTLPDA